MTNDLIINPRSNEREKLGNTRERQGRVTAYSNLILLFLVSLTIPIFQTSDLGFEDSNPSTSAREINNLQFSI